MFQALSNSGRVVFKNSAGTVLTSAFATWNPIFSGQSLDDGDINRVTFIAHFSQRRLITKLVKQSHYVWVDAVEYYLITGCEDFGPHTKITGTRQSVPMAFQVSGGVGIVSQYEFRSSGALLTDEKALNTLVNASVVTQSSAVPSHLSSEVGSAVFVAASSQYLYLNDANQVQLDITGSLTVAMWLKATTHTGTQGLLSKGQVAPNAGYYFYKNSSGKILLELSTDGTATSSAQGSTIVPLNTWTSVAGVYNGTDIRIYVNGVLDSNGSSNPSAYTGGIFNNGQFFALGARGDVAQFLNGSLANVHVCNQTKSAAQILDWHNTGVLS